MLGKVDSLLFVTTNRCIPIKNTLYRGSVVLFMSENKVIFIVFCLVRTVHKSDCMLVTNEAPNKWGPAFVKKNHDRTVIEDYVF